MATEHNVIGDGTVDSPYDGERHEPRSISRATDKDVYVANGSGGGAWTPNAAYSSINGDSSTASTAMTTSFLQINQTTLGGNFTWAAGQNFGDTNTVGTTGDVGFHTILANGDYQMTANVSFHRNSGTGNAEYEITFGIDSGAGIVTQESTVHSFRSASSSTETGFFAVGCIVPLLAGDKVYLMIRENDSPADPEILFDHINFYIHRVSS